MLKKLRNKMLWFNMVLISIIVLGAFTFIYILNATQIIDLARSQHLSCGTVG